ncbi:hypothetical protein BDR04DRAFT_1122341 [Suillus decipiens]|nr:hypothetical protein BDR04DRAFT_1122341 [Suillus decipiens]
MSPAAPYGPAMITTYPATASLLAITTSPTSKASQAPASVTSSPLPPAVTMPPTSKASQALVSATSLPLIRMSEPLEDIMNQSVRHSSCTHVPSTHLAEANNIGTHKRV